MFERHGYIIPSLNKKEKAMLLFLLVFLLAFFYYRFLLGPQIKSYLSVKTELTRLKAQVAQTYDVAGSIRSETDAVNAADRRLEEAKVKYSIKLRESSTLFLLGQWASREKVVITSYQPGFVANKGAYLEMPLKIGLRGGYQDLLALIRQLEEMGNLAQIRFINIKKYTPASFTRVAGEQEGFLVPGAPMGQDLVVAELNMLIYSDATKQGLIVLDEISNWEAGRQNAFLPPPGSTHIVGGSGTAPSRPAAKPGLNTQVLPVEGSGQAPAVRSAEVKSP